MTIQVTQAKRVFIYGSAHLPDPGEGLSPEEVRDVYSASFPEIVSAAIEGPVAKNGTLEFTFRKAVGSKG